MSEAELPGSDETREDPLERLPTGSAPATYNLLFVCTGNTCRSPMAAAITRRKLEDRGWTQVAVASAGVGAAEGLPAAQNALAVTAVHGLDLSAHRSTPLSPHIVAWADLILGMAPAHVEGAVRMGGAGRAAMLTDFLGGPLAGLPIDDPFGGSEAEYRSAFEQLDAAIEAVLSRLEPILAP